MYDYVIIGSGIIGSFIAKELSMYQLKVLVLEKENDVVNGQTIANSAIIHAGYDVEPGTLKAKLCVEGNRLYEQVEKELSIPLLRTGGLVVATNEKEKEMLDIVYENALKNGVEHLRILNASEIKEREPNLSDHVIAALDLPSTKVTFPWQVAMACLTFAKLNGVKIMTNSKVTDITHADQTFKIEINQQSSIEAKHIISCAGVFSDYIARMIEDDLPYQILPRKGEYYVLDRRVKGLFQNVIYPLPNEKGKGVLIVPQTHGNILLGPTSTDTLNREDVSTTKEGLAYIRKEVHHLSNVIHFNQIIRSFAGVRAKSTYHDFYIKPSLKYPNFYHVAGIDSPGLTAAPSIAKYLVDEVLHEKLIKKTELNKHIPGFKLFHEMSEDEKNQMIKKDSRYGNIVCKCELVTEKDIIDAIHHPLGSLTIKGIKKRVRPGSGLCQGSFCEREVLKIIARESGQDMASINYESLDSPILCSKKKVEQ